MLDEFLNVLTTDRPAAWVEARPVTARRMHAVVESLARSLARDQPRGRDHTSFAFARDRVAFAAALLGTWRAGLGATLPADARRELVEPSMHSSGTGILLHDTGVGRGIDVAALMERESPDRLAAASPDPCPPVRTVLHTIGRDACGSSFGRVLPPIDGHADLLVRGWDEGSLRAELDRLARDIEWPSAGATVCTLAPSSLPSVLLGVLLPIVRRASFANSVPRTAEETARVVRACGARVLVSSPAHLRALLTLARGELGELACVVSTWNRMDPGLAEELTARHGVRVHEALVLESARTLSERARAWGIALRGIPGVEDCAVVESAAGRAAIVQAPTIGSTEIERLQASAAARIARVDRVPRDPNGGVTDADVWRHFGCDPTGSPLALDLEFDERTDSAVRVTIPARSAWFEGHFRGAPVLAGAVQLQEIVLPALRRLLKREVYASRWSALKFAARILPGDSVEVACTWAIDKHAAKFEIRREDEVCTSGSLTFTSEPGA